MSADAYIRDLVDKAPPFTAEQVARLSTLLDPVLGLMYPAPAPSRRRALKSAA